MLMFDCAKQLSYTMAVKRAGAMLVLLLLLPRIHFPFHTTVPEETSALAQGL